MRGPRNGGLRTWSGTKVSSHKRSPPGAVGLSSGAVEERDWGLGISLVTTLRVVTPDWTLRVLVRRNIVCHAGFRFPRTQSVRSRAFPRGAWEREFSGNLNLLCPPPPPTPNRPCPVAAPRQYVVVARRYRPQTFAELIGQEHVAQALSNAISTHRVGHAYLFTGARGVGKTSAARILAKALNCEKGPAPVPCNQCDICRSISTGEDVDVLEIDGASNRGIDEIRQLRQNVGVRPSRSRFKIYIIDEVHMLTREAFNALLKTLEEPPEHVKFIFCTTEPTKIPITILSRCQRFDFAGILTRSISERLRQIVAAEGVEADPDALEVLARRAAGSMRDSQSLLEQLLAFSPGRITVADVHGMLGTAGEERLASLVGHLIERNPAGALADLDGATQRRRRRRPIDRATLRLPPRLHGRGGRLPERGASLHLPLRCPTGGRGGQAARIGHPPGGHADSRPDPLADAVQHARANPGRTGVGEDQPFGGPRRTVRGDFTTPVAAGGCRAASGGGKKKT